MRTFTIALHVSGICILKYTGKSNCKENAVNVSVYYKLLVSTTDGCRKYLIIKRDVILLFTFTQHILYNNIDNKSRTLI